MERQEEIDYDFSDDEDEDEDEDKKMQEDEDKESDAEEDDAMDDEDEVKDDAEVPKDDDTKTVKKAAAGLSSLPKLANASLEQYSADSIKNDISVLEKERDTLAKNANMGAIAEYRKKEADYLSR